MTKLTHFIATHKTRIQFLAPLLYIAFVVLTSLYINTTLKNKDIDIKELPDEEKVESRDKKDIDVRIIVMDINNTIAKEVLLPNTDNTDTINEVLEEAREQGLLYYERVNFTYGTELEQVLDIKLPPSYAWRVFFGTEDITNRIVKIALIDKDDLREIVLRPMLTN